MYRARNDNLPHYAGELGDGGLENASPSKRKRRTGDLNPEATLEPFFDALNVKKFDLAFAVDPLFQKTSAQFDEGGAKGLLLNNLSVYRGCDLVFDSMDVPEAAADDPAPAAAAACVSLDGLKPQLQALAQLRGGERISPALDDILALLGAAPGEGASAEAEAFVARIAADGATPASTGPEDWMVGASAPGSPAEMQGMSGDGAVGAESGREEAGEVPAPYDVDDGDDFDGGADFGGKS